MGATLPDLGSDRFEERLRAVVEGPVVAESELIQSLFAHYEELRRWNPRLSLVGPGSASEVVERHYGESLAALPLLGTKVERLVDLGSGGGFPGLPLAAAAPGSEVWLVEPRQRKWAFLRSATAAARLSCRCLNARVTASLPSSFPDRIDVVTIRALKLDAKTWAAIRERLSARGRVLCWSGSVPPAGLAGWRRGRQIRLPGRDRSIMEMLPPDES